MKQDVHRRLHGAINRRRSWGWTALATALIVIGALMAIVANVASWAKVQLTDTDVFVAVYAPLARDAGVQAFLAAQTMDLINENVDIPGLTAEVFDGIADLGTPPRLTRALNSLKGPAALGIESQIRSTVDDALATEAFARTWQESLRLSHSRLIPILQNEPLPLLEIGANGSVGVQLGPIVEQVKQEMTNRGIGFAAQIPAVDRTVVLVDDTQLPTLQLLYSVAVMAGIWLPWAALALMATGVLVARRRSVALVWAGMALGLAMALVVAAISIGGVAFGHSVSPSLMPAEVATTFYATLTGSMTDTAVAVMVLALVVALVAWFAGPFRGARNLRALMLSGTAAIRRGAERHGITSGRAGHWVQSQRALLHVAIAVVAGATILLVRPMSIALIGWTLVLSLLGLLIIELLRRPVQAPADVPESTTP